MQMSDDGAESAAQIAATTDAPPAAEPVLGRTGTFAPLAEPTFRRIWVSSLFSNFGQEKQRIDVDGHRVEPRTVAGVGRAGAIQDAGIVDEHVEAAEFADRGRDERIARTRLAQVLKSPAAAGADCRDDRVAARAVPARDHHGGAGPGEQPRAGLADAGRRPRNQHGFPGKASCIAL